MDLENGLYAQVVMIRRREFGDKKEKDEAKNITFKENQQKQKIGLILTMSGRKKIS